MKKHLNYFTDLFYKTKNDFLKYFKLIFFITLGLALLSVEIENENPTKTSSQFNEIIWHNMDSQEPDNFWIYIFIQNIIIGFFSLGFLYHLMKKNNKLFSSFYQLFKNNAIWRVIGTTILELIFYILAILPGFFIFMYIQNFYPNFIYLGIIILILSFILLLYLAIHWLFTIHSALFRNKIGYSALNYSFKITNKNFWNIILNFVILSLIGFIITFIVLLIIYLITSTYGITQTTYILSYFIEIWISLLWNYFVLIFTLKYFLALEN